MAVPGAGDPNYTIHKETVRVYKMIIARKRAVRIYKIDEWGCPWYAVKFRRKDGTWDDHWLNLMPGETNWVLVKKRKQ